MTTPASPVLGRGELTSSGSARPDNVPLLPLDQPKSRVDINRPRVQSPLAQAQTRPVTAEGQFQHVAVPAARLDSYTTPQTRFWCPSCRCTFVVGDDGCDLFDDLSCSRPVAAVASTFGLLAGRGALHPERLLFLEARKRFYSQHVAACKIIQAEMQERARVRAEQEAAEFARTGVKSALKPPILFVGGESEEDASNGGLQCLDPQSRAAFGKWIRSEPAGGSVAGTDMTSARMRALVMREGSVEGSLAQSSRSRHLGQTIDSAPSVPPDGGGDPLASRHRPESRAQESKDGSRPHHKALTNNKVPLTEDRGLTVGAHVPPAPLKAEARRLGSPANRQGSARATSPQVDSSGHGAMSGAGDMAAPARAVAVGTAPPPRPATAPPRADSREALRSPLSSPALSRRNRPKQRAQAMDWHCMHLGRLKVHPLGVHTATSTARQSPIPSDRPASIRFAQ